MSLDTKDMVDCLEHIALFCILTQFSNALGCFKMITQLLDSDWPNTYENEKENGLMSPDGVRATY